MIRINPQDLHWQNPRAQELILSGGSKAGVYRFLSEHPTLREHLPENTQIMEPGDDPKKFTESIKFGNRRKIVRGFHKFDFFGMVDVLKSIPAITPDTLSGNIDIVLGEAKSRDVMSFEEYEFGQGVYDGNIEVMSQDFYSGNPYLIAKNPHLRDSYIIEQVRAGSAPRNLTNLAIYDFDARNTRIHSSFSRIDTNETLERAMIDFFKEVIDLGIAPEGFTIMMELGLDEKTDKFVIYQVKLFRKIEPVDDFYTPGLPHTMEPWQSFGKTSERGIELKSDTLNEAFIEQYVDEENMCYVNKSMLYESSPLSVQPKNMYTFISFDEGILVHGACRWTMKADVFMKMLGNEQFHFMGPQRLKIYSNGFDGGAVILNE